MSLLEIKHLKHQFGDKLLYRDEGFTVEKGEHIGVVGQNGAGKTTLFTILKGQLTPDEGDLRYKKGTRVEHLDQLDKVGQDMTIRQFLLSAFRELAQMEQQMEALYLESAVNGDEACLKRAAAIQDQLLDADYYTADSQVDKVAAGLGLSAMGLDCSLSALSGGQRSKAALGRLLLRKSDLMLLDEPTNFLDQDHVEWLSQWLAARKEAYLVISHNTEFLSRISTAILDVELGQITKYHGSYSHFLKQKEHLRRDYQSRYQAQQREIQRTEAFIRKNIAGVNTRIAQGRRTRLARMERLEAPGFAETPTFRFREIETNPGTVFETKNLLVGYSEPLLPPMSFSIEGGEKWAVTGFNGVGKSTLLNTLTGRIKPLAGTVTADPLVKAVYYDQELNWPDGTISPLKLILDSDSALTRQTARRRLSQCGVKGDLAGQPLSQLSGGEQSKVKLCLLLLQDYNVLILDEPTNHMDRETKEVLREQLRAFNGTVLLVSHEPEFYQDWVDHVLEL